MKMPCCATRFTRVLAFLAGALLCCASAFAQIPQAISYQGVLTNAAGQPLNASVAMTVRLYDQLSGPNAALYTESQTVAVANGVFNVQIGAVTPLTLAFDKPYFVEISVGGETLSPRQPLASSAYAFRAGCVPGDRVSCYTFANGAPGQGLCQAGVRVCNAQGTDYGACTGQVGPNCGTQCINTQTDSSNCGTCGNVCPAGNACVAGSCTSTSPVCGNGIVEAGEECDNGAGNNNSALCTAACKFNICGDGHLATLAPQLGEQCDDGNKVNGDGCSSTCKIESCGNGIVDPGEQCDDGNVTNGDGCSSACKVEAHFTCAGAPSVCAAVAPACGNGILEAGEECDDGNTANGDGCSSTCKREFCGDGIVNNGEECDAGNANGTLVGNCTLACRRPICGNGFVDAGEECDFGAANSINGSCLPNCKLAKCGDGVVVFSGFLAGSEQCDDGNNVNGDGCSSTCKLEACGNGIVDPGEQCDDGNVTNGDGCSSACKVEAHFTCAGVPSVCAAVTPVCGNGILEPGEQCDDGNTANGDGCSSTCTVEAHFSCVGTPSVCS